MKTTPLMCVQAARTVQASTGQRRLSADLAEQRHDARLFSCARRPVEQQVAHPVNILFATNPLELLCDIFMIVELLQLVRSVFVHPQHCGALFQFSSWSGSRQYLPSGPKCGYGPILAIAMRYVAMKGSLDNVCEEDQRQTETVGLPRTQ
eukprot:2230311-Rhodomonas_salina.2